MNRYLVIWTKYSDICEQVTDRTIKLIIRIIQSKPWSINFVITLEVYIGPIELKWANKRIALAPEFCIVDVKENFGSIKLIDCHVRKLKEKLFVKDGVVCSRFDLMLDKMIPMFVWFGRWRRFGRRNHMRIFRLNWTSIFWRTLVRGHWAHTGW